MGRGREKEQNLSSWYQRDTALGHLCSNHMTGNNEQRDRGEGPDASLEKPNEAPERPPASDRPRGCSHLAGELALGTHGPDACSWRNP